MSEHRAGVRWKLAEDGEGFLAGRYSRAHALRFDDGLEVPGTPSPSVVPSPWSRTAAVDPEAAFTSAISACHMLWFLDLARQAGFVVASYEDEAAGTLARVGRGKMAMTRVVLRPKIIFTGEKRPAEPEIAELHHRAHELCFIANSVTTEVTIEATES